MGTNAEEYAVYRNLGKATASGIESSLTGKWENGWHGRVSYSFLETRDEITKMKLSNAPQQIGKLLLSAPIATSGLVLSGQINFLGSRKDHFSSTLPSTTLFNAILNYDKFWRSADASLGVYNLFDKTYSNVGILDARDAQFRQDGRTLQFKLTYGF